MYTRPILNLKTFTQIENLTYNLNQWKYAYLRVSENKKCADYCLLMIKEHEKLLASYPLGWLAAVQMIMSLR